MHAEHEKLNRWFKKSLWRVGSCMRHWIEIVMTSLNCNDVTSNKNRNDVRSNYQTGVKWTLDTLVQCQDNRYIVGTHASFYFRLIISQMIKLTQWVTHTIK